MADMYIAESPIHGLGVFAAREQTECGGPEGSPDVRRWPRAKL